MFTFDTKRFRVLSPTDVVLCSSLKEAKRLVTNQIYEVMKFAGLSADDYEFTIELLQIRSPMQNEFDRYSDDPHPLASEDEFWNFAYRFDCWANATE